MRLNKSQIEFVVRCVSLWIKLARENNKSFSVTKERIENSSLLKRLLAGEKPYEYPPPLYESYPWTSLLEKGYVEGQEVNVIQLSRDKVMLGKSIWNVIDRVSPDEYILGWPEGPWKIRVKRMASRGNKLSLYTWRVEPLVKAERMDVQL